ncbi:AI-2E family transporter [Clostridium pasteurianum]|uniref:Putative permease n=1 Tax=Clostridium pasteurianum BC1 TaxID=86416 RepID=R4KFP3_CLOPA|nr:AI-2E family transporter [Clostridium pasteurianum]AGK98425.1 putative permease [Clostridium pasteurianum BC1]
MLKISLVVTKALGSDKVKKNIIYYLIIINLTLLAFNFLGKMAAIRKIIGVVDKAFLIPLFVSILIYYIIRPLNNIFIKKGLGYGRSSILTLIIFAFVLSGVFYYFSNYAYEQFQQISSKLWQIINDRKNIDGIINWVNNFINVEEIYSLATLMVKHYIQGIGYNFKRIISYFMNAFSMVLLIIVIVFYMLKDGHKFKEKLLTFIPEKYRDTSDRICDNCDDVLSHYVTGQAKVALSLSIMIFIGYIIIKMPNAMLLSSITFVLAFIPFIGFFISMIIPVIIALSMGLSMIIKLIVVFIIVQTLKGRIVVPAIMSKSMNIHPLTDIFLVISAISIAGPFAAFAVVPIYAIIKNTIIILKKIAYKKAN